MNLYNKYRPTELHELIGNQNTVNVLNSLLQKDDKPHSYLFTGETGCGKTTIGRILAKKLGSEGIDFRELNTADFRGIDSVRDIRKQMQYTPIVSKCLIWLIDECHKLTNDAQNALLKLLEDTPKHVYFILATTEPNKLLSTIKGRCSTFSMNTLNNKEMYKVLRKVVIKEKQELNQEVYDQIIQDAMGHPRNALEVLEQVLVVPAEKRLSVAKIQAEKHNEVIELCRVLLNNSSWKNISSILSSLKSQNIDAENIRRIVMGYAQAVLLKKENNVAGLILEEFIEPFYNSGFPGLVYACYSVYINM